MDRIKAWWHSAVEHAHKHHRIYHKAHHGTHLCYLGMVAFHGPYNLAAMCLFFILILGLALHLEGDV